MVKAKDGFVSDESDDEGERGDWEIGSPRVSDFYYNILQLGCCCSILRASLAIRKIKYFNETQERPNVAFRPNSPFECFSNLSRFTLRPCGPRGERGYLLFNNDILC